MTSKFHVKVGSVELDFEGGEELFKSDVLPIVTKLIDSQPIKISKDDTDGDGSMEEIPVILPEPDSKQKITLSVTSIAAKLSVKTGPELIIAACAYMHFVEERDTFTRSQILETMKQAKAYFTTNITSNLSAYLGTLIKNDRLNEVKQDTYALPQAQINELEAKLGK